MKALIFSVAMFCAFQSTSALACVMPGMICGSITDVCCVGGGWCNGSLTCPIPDDQTLKAMGLECQLNQDGGFTCAPKDKTNDNAAQANPNENTSSSAEQN